MFAESPKWLNQVAVAHAIAALQAERDEARACAYEALPYVEDHLDVVDGADGVPLPNAAMRLAQRIGGL